MRQEREIRMDNFRALRQIAAGLMNASGNLKRAIKPEEVLPLPGDKKKDNGFSKLRRNGQAT
jgi:hypothetical protein